jgi:hypothetical protein
MLALGVSMRILPVLDRHMRDDDWFAAPPPRRLRFSSAVGAGRRCRWLTHLPHGATVYHAWWARKDLNLGPMDYESTALTAELRAHDVIKLTQQVPSGRLTNAPDFFSNSYARRALRVES